jgi:hypothetical protein
MGWLKSWGMSKEFLSGLYSNSAISEKRRRRQRKQEKAVWYKGKGILTYDKDQLVDHIYNFPGHLVALDDLSHGGRGKIAVSDGSSSNPLFTYSQSSKSLEVECSLLKDLNKVGLAFNPSKVVIQDNGDFQI